MPKLNFKLISILFIWLICSQNLIVLAVETEDNKNKVENPVIGIDLVQHIHV